jgi:hypothetical protein
VGESALDRPGSTSIFAKLGVENRCRLGNSVRIPGVWGAGLMTRRFRLPPWAPCSMDRRRIMDENGRRYGTAVQNGSLLRLSESREIVIYRRDGVAWVADFRGGRGDRAPLSALAARLVDALARLSNEFSCRSGALSPSTQRS